MTSCTAESVGDGEPKELISGVEGRPPRTVSSPLPSGQRVDSAIQNQSSGAEPEQGSSGDDSSMVGNALQRMVNGLEQNFHTREDLLQEARIHFWFIMQKRSQSKEKVIG